MLACKSEKRKKTTDVYLLIFTHNTFTSSNAKTHTTHTQITQLIQKHTPTHTQITQFIQKHRNHIIYTKTHNTIYKNIVLSGTLITNIPNNLTDQHMEK